MGATRGAVMRIFLIAGTSIGVTGTLIGFVARGGVLRQYRKHPPGPAELTGTPLFDPTVYFLSHMPAELDPMRSDVGGGDGAGADLPGDALSVLAGGAARSGRGAAL